jgi:type I restriction enzyme S subunit
LLNGGTPNTNTNKYWNGNIPWVTGADFANQALSQVRRRITAAAVQQSTTKMVKAGSILLVTRTGVGKIAIAPYDVAFSQDITGINFGDSVDVRFMYYCLQAHMEEFKKLNQGTSINGILKEDFLAYQINLPPLPQQRKIAKILTTVDNLIEKTEALIAKYQSIKQGMMHDLFTRGVDSNGKLRPAQSEAPELYKQSELGWIPKEWEIKTVGDLANYVNGHSFNANVWSNQGLPIIRIQNLNGEQTFNYYKGAVDPSWEVLYGDLLFAWSGMIETSFGPRVWKGSRGVLNQHIFKVISNGSLVLKDFLDMLLRHNLQRIVLFAHGFKSSFVHVTRAELLPVKLALPDRNEQLQILEKITKAESILQQEKLFFRNLDKIKQGLMQDLLNGKVQVTPDVEDKELAHA